MENEAAEYREEHTERDYIHLQSDIERALLLGCENQDEVAGGYAVSVRSGSEEKEDKHI